MSDQKDAGADPTLTQSDGTTDPSLPAGMRLSSMRWWVLFLLFCSTLLNYADRIVLAVLVPVIRDQLHFNETVYGYITAAFQSAYTIGALICGHLLDLYGTRIGMIFTVGIWSLAASLHASVGNPFQLGIWRGLLGLAEAGNFPAANKAAAEWFPPQERAFAVGVFTAGINVAAIIGPPIFIAIQEAYGWRACFLLTGAAGFLWLVAWLLFYRSPGKTDSPVARSISLKDTLSCREAWGFSIAKFLTDPVWWFYLYWMPLYFHDVRKFDMRELAWALPVIYLLSDAGAVSGGWFSGYMLRRGWSLAASRKRTMLICACLMPLAALGVLAENSVATVLLFSLATFSHQAWMTNLFTTVSDVFPSEAVGRVLGLGGCFGGFGGVLFSALIPGFVIGRVGYTPLFLSMSCLYAIAMFIVHILMRDLRTVDFDRSRSALPNEDPE